MELCNSIYELFDATEIILFLDARNISCDRCSSSKTPCKPLAECEHQYCETCIDEDKLDSCGICDLKRDRENELMEAEKDTTKDREVTWVHEEENGTRIFYPNESEKESKETVTDDRESGSLPSA